jgi:histidinol-phosphate phosphatase family protein
MQAVILAGGAGTRLRNITGDLPKALVDIAGKPLLHRQLELLAQHGFARVLLLVKYGADDIRASCGDGAAWGISIDYLEESCPLGTAGALLDALDKLDERFAVLYGDTVLNVDLGRMWAAHGSRAADMTLFVHPNDHPFDSDIVETDADSRVIALHPYPHPRGADLPNLVNAALYVIEKTCLKGIQIPKSADTLDLAKNLIPILLRAGKNLYAYQSREYIKDAGTDERLAAATADVASGRVARGSLTTPAAAVFLDRDGTLVDDPGYIANPDQIKLLPDVSEAVRRIDQSGYLAVLVTNQPVIARGDTDEPGLKVIHNRLEQMLGRGHAYLDAIYYCPHHPEGGFAGENPKYKIACACRKPGLGMIERATADMNIDLTRSWIVGDTSTDLEMARRAGIRSVLVSTGHGGRDGRYPQRADFEVPDLAAAADLILDAWPAVEQRAAQVARELRPGDVVLIGGLARSGKSTFASALAWTLRQTYGANPKPISLDGWIAPLEQRRNGTVVDRFNMHGIESALAPAFARGGKVEVPLYDRQRRTPGKTYTVSIDPSDIVILEGVVALLLRPPDAKRIVRIYVARNENVRYETMASDYRSRGFTDKEFSQLYLERQEDEVPIISETRGAADFVVELQ